MVDGGSNAVVQAWFADPEAIADFLNDMEAIPGSAAAAPDDAHRDPDAWGDPVAVRSEEGDVLFIEPEMFWNRIAALFRSRGNDPHPWRGRRP
ncbi:hypothetical protein [Egicoccus halophilus]|uniref:Uncharacterized protein n=1 Tax=Egicoccus halophilus TaxID=1670830 RepID=A0A8J3A793_9ACTN|nr:hypothetical protein [Egicoccus halophilus]GGI02344.1 hypothetical protein GCM10011354_00040 [Egicoccus halophilus]